MADNDVATLEAEMARRGLSPQSGDEPTAGDYASELRRRGLDVRGGIEERLRSTVGPVVGGAIESIAPLVAPVIGGAMGAAAGTPLGPPGMAVGAGLGAAAGGGVNVLGEDVLRASQGQSPLTMGEAVGTMAEQGIAGMGAQALGSTLAGGLSLMRGGATKLRQIVANAAKNLGVELTAAEQTGSRMLNIAESITKRSLGAGPFEAFGRRQSGQLIGASERTLGTTVEEAGQTATRSNRFFEMLEDLREGFKIKAGQSFRAYEGAVGGADQTLQEANLHSFFAGAKKLQENLSIFPELRNTKMEKLLGQIEKYRKGMVDRVQVKPQHEAAIRKMMGLRPDEPLEAANLPLASDPQFAQFFETVPAKLPTLAQIRQVRSDLGDLAFPGRVKGSVTVDAPVAQAKQLWGALADDLEAHAAAKGGLAFLQESNQMYRVDLAQLDKKIYAKMLEGTSSLPDISKKLFNPRDQSTLLDAKSILTDDGFKMIQQQWVDDVLLGGNIIKPMETGGFAFNGRAFAERVFKDRRVLDVLYPPDTVKALTELAEVARVASPTSNIMTSDLVGILISSGQGAAIATGIMQGGFVKTALGLAPYGFSKIATNPTGIKLLTNTIRAANAGRGYLTGDVAQAITKLSTRGAASAVAPALNPYATGMNIQTPEMARE